MKNSIAFFLLMVGAICCHAATVDWKWTSSAGVKFGSTALGGDGTAYLLFIGDKEAADYSFDYYVKMASTASSDEYITYIKSAATKMSKINVSPCTTPDTPGNFVSVLSYKSGNDTYWNVSSSIYELTQENIDKLLSEGTSLPDSSFAFSNSVSSGSGSVGGGWAQVPEPSTAALALAGLALLLKRRKA